MTQPTAPARQRFLALLRRNILELDAGELDFGIYRMVNQRRATVERFLGEELPAQIEAALAALPGAVGEDEQARISNHCRCRCCKTCRCLACALTTYSSFWTC